MSRLSLFITLVALVTVANAAPRRTSYADQGICSLPFCYCDEALHPYWTAVNCTVPAGEKLDVLKGDLPQTAIELTINGPDEVVFGESSFTGVMDLRRITIRNVKKIVFREFAAINLRAPNLYLNIENCNELRFEKSTFIQLRGPLSITIQNCDAVYIEGTAFSWVLDMEISNVRELNIGSGAFSLEPGVANIGEHGPGMTIELMNVTIPEIPKSGFGSSAGQLYMESVDIQAIRTGAFSANTYNIVIAINCSLHLIEEEAFSENSLINYLNLDGCKIHQFKSRALRSAMTTINITSTSFESVESGAINSTVASVYILDSKFHDIMENGFQFSSLNVLQMERNSFDELPANAISTPGASINELIFNENEIETPHENSLAFIGKAAETYAIEYRRNYYGQPCHCDINEWIAKVVGAETGELYKNESFCTVDELIARCFNVADQNMLAQKFVDQVCVDSQEIKCEKYKTKTNGTLTIIENPRFPHKGSEKGLSHRNAKVIGIVIVTCFGCVLIAMIISLIRWLKRRGYCFSLKNLLMSSNTRCGKWCARLCNCGNTLGVDNARSISQLSVNEYSERHYLNDYRGQDRNAESSFQETELQSVTIEPSAPVPTIEKCTQTLPQQLSKELIDNLKESLENPEIYVEAREMIEHLYEIAKLDNSPPPIPPANPPATVENIYELPFQNVTPRIGKNNERMVSVGTKVPSLEKLTPLSPYYRQTALADEYFEPKDLAVHLYDEITNDNENKKTLLGAMPDVIGEQPVPRGPYLQKVLSNQSSPKSSTKSRNLHEKPNMTEKSNSSKSSGKMKNRPLPKKPVVDPGEGTSTKHG